MVWLAVLLPVALAAMFFVGYFRAQPHWLADPDAQDYAQLGRQMAAGRGATTRFMPWNGLDFLAKRDPAFSPDAPWPNIVRFPLTPVLMAASFAVFGPTDEAVHLPDALAYVLAAGLAGLLAARVYGPWAGLTAGLATAALPMLLNYSLTGLTEPLIGMLLLAMLACVVPGREGARSLGWLAAGGAMLGLATLNRYDTALLALPIGVLYLLPRPDRFRAALWFAVPAALVVLPWSAYMTVVAGSPLFNLQPASIATQVTGIAGGGLGWYWPLYMSPAEVWAVDPSRSVRLAVTELIMTPDRLRKTIGTSWLLAGLAACVLEVARVWRGWGVRGHLALFLVAAVVLRALTVSVVGLNLPRYYVPLVPLLLAIVAGEAETLARGVASWLGRFSVPRSPIRAAGRLGILAVLVVPSVLATLPLVAPPSSPPGPSNRPGEVEARAENLARLAEIVGPDRLVASNVPWSVAWIADRRAVPLPPTVEDTAVLEQRYRLRLDAIYVAGQVSLADAPRSWRDWDEVRRRGTPPPGYVLAETFGNGGRLFVKAP